MNKYNKSSIITQVVKIKLVKYYNTHIHRLVPKRRNKTSANYYIRSTASTGKILPSALPSSNLTTNEPMKYIFHRTTSCAGL